MPSRLSGLWLILMVQAVTRCQSDGILQTFVCLNKLFRGGEAVFCIAGGRMGAWLGTRSASATSEIYTPVFRRSQHALPAR